jgi:hypothetical protein
VSRRRIGYISAQGFPHESESLNYQASVCALVDSAAYADAAIAPLVFGLRASQDDHAFLALKQADDCGGDEAGHLGSLPHGVHLIHFFSLSAGRSPSVMVLTSHSESRNRAGYDQSNASAGFSRKSCQAVSRAKISAN